MPAIHPPSSAIRHRDPPAGTATDGSRTYRTGFWLIAGAFALAMAFSAAPAPIYPLYETRDRFGPFTVTLVFVLSLLLAGHVSDWLGRRRMLLTAFAVLVTAAVVFLAWPELPGLFIARFLTGLGIGIISPAATAQLHELKPGTARTPATAAPPSCPRSPRSEGSASAR
jgi:MFS family permease